MAITQERLDIDVRVSRAAARQLEDTYMTQTRRNTYTALEELEFHWDRIDVYRFEKLWRDGVHLADIADEFDRPVEEVFVLALDRVMKGHIKKRPGFVYGKGMGM